MFEDRSLSSSRPVTGGERSGLIEKEGQAVTRLQLVLERGYCLRKCSTIVIHRIKLSTWGHGAVNNTKFLREGAAQRQLRPWGHRAAWLIDNNKQRALKDPAHTA